MDRRMVSGAGIGNMLGEAVRLHQAGDLEQAAKLYGRVLSADPRNADALHLLGMIALDNGQADAAAELARRAIAINDREASFHFALGLALQSLNELENALASYRRALALRPDDAGTHNNMGNALVVLGRLDQAADAFQRALALAPGSVVVLNNLGNAQWNMGARADAEESYDKALSLQPDYADALINLGNIRREKGAFDEAERLHRRAVALAPQSAAAHCSLGLTAWEQGRRGEAEACYRDALTRDPRHAEALANLAIARWHDGALEDAEALFSRALAINPLNPDVLTNNAALRLERRDAMGALELIQRSLAMRETERAKRLFTDLARQASWSDGNDALRGLMARALSEPWDRPGELARAGAELVKSHPVTGPLVARADASWPHRLGAAQLLGDAGFAPLAKDTLLTALLTVTPNTDIALERFLTMARGILAQEDRAHAGAEMFASVVARQCFLNEYVFLADETEMATAARARATLAAGDALSPIQLLVLAAYFPLHRLAGAEKLLEQSWPAPVEAVLTQQLREPLEERRLGAEIPVLTSIEDKVSRLVRSQYEENPYPRWAKLARGTRTDIARFFRAKFPTLPLERETPMKDVLIAGCGTGQQSIAAASRFGDGAMLAVDLSLASLAYARRKSDETGLAIAYGQADILELGTLGRQFDVIESIGVLHHMADPYQGWQTLLALLRPGGFMLLGLYSAVARRPVAQVRADIAARGLGGSAEEIRQFRQDFMENGDPALRAAILNSEDFFSISACRDLMFHVQEQGLRLAEIADFLNRQNLRFLGFDLNQAVLDSYRKHFPEDKAALDLHNWERFEADNPGLFAEMYVFWIQKLP
jgi:Tfp pilus assembly protein PilF/2-polyprenyl-3-methyl-5-hydroxy-6-metoxy-1,4-benzoquinol methylase